MKFQKILPYLFLGIALVGLYMNYRQWQHAHKDCDCSKESSGATVIP